MLTAQRMAVVAAALGATIISAAPAHADNPGGNAGSDCGSLFCQVEVDVPGTGGGGNGGGSSSAGGASGGSGGGGQNKPATQPVCTYSKLDPQPPASSLDWEGHAPGDGAVYEETCTFDNGLTEFAQVRNVWRATPPAAAAVDPAVLAQQALDKMLLRGPEIGIVPKPGGLGLVGMPVYMWTERGPETYGPNVASASAGGITVTATAKVRKIVWQMGDGKTVTCTTPGTPYKVSYGKKSSPDCGHRYSQPSLAGAYHVVATSTWTVDWQATTGQTGQITQTRRSTVDIRVGELQAVGSS